MTDWTPFTARAKTWFEHLRDLICAEFEAIEREAGSDAAFAYTPWQRASVEGEPVNDTGGGVQGLMKGKVFEKVGVNVSTVHGSFSPEFARSINGADRDFDDFAAAPTTSVTKPKEIVKEGLSDYEATLAAQASYFKTLTLHSREQLLYGLTDALPVLITTVVLVVNFDVSRGAMQGLVLHAKFEGPGVLFYVSDNDDAEPMRGSAHLLLLDDRDETTALFRRLADGGTITTPLGPQPWSTLYGKLTDRFGVQWMLNCPVG